MLKTLKSRLLVFILSAAILTLVVVMVYTRINVDLEINRAYEKNAIDYLESTYLNVESEYNSIKFHENIIIESKRKELANIGEIASSILNHYYKLYTDKVLSEKEAKHAAIEKLEYLKYDDGIGYFWINSNTLPYPTMIMHPKEKQLNGKKLYEERFNTVQDTGENLFTKAVKIVRDSGEGYLQYKWHKPVSSSQRTKAEGTIQPKLSYVFLFEPWDWVIGSGVYVDDIDKKINERLTAVIKEMQRGLSTVNLFKTGYLFIFTEDNRIIYHPYYDYLFDISGLKNPETGRSLSLQLRDAALNQDNYFDYKWSKVENPKSELFLKRSYVKYFEPLNWYIASSFYVDDMKQPGIILIRRLIYISLVALILSTLLILFLTTMITKPLNNLMKGAKAIEIEKNLSLRLPVKGSSETKALGKILNEMIASIQHHKEDMVKSESRLRALVENSPDGIMMINEEGIITLDNNRIQYKGLQSPKRIFDYFEKDQKEYLYQQISEVFKTGKHSSFALKLRHYNRWYQLSIGIIPSETGYHNATVLTTDITEIREIQHKLEINNQRFTTVLDSIDAAIYVADPNTYEILFANKYLRDIHGDINGKICWKTIQTNQTGPCDFCTNSKLLDENNNPTGVYHWQFTNTINNVWYDIRDLMIPWTDGRMVRLEVATDISVLKSAEQKIIENLKEKEVLLKEIHHRVKNNIQIIYSLLKMQSRFIKDEEDKHMFMDSENRVKSMAIIHEQLYESKNLADINFDTFVNRIAREMGIMYNSSAIFKIEIDNIHLDINLGIPCGLIINELISNSLKYSGKNGEELHINIKFTHHDNEYFLSVSDNGVGLPEDLDLENLNSLGLQLISALKKQIGAEMNVIRKPGTTFTFRFKRNS